MRTFSWSGSDPDGDPLSFSWSLAVPDGSSAELAGSDTEMPSFITDAVGNYLAELTVNDGEFTATDSVIVAAVDPNANAKPVAVAEAVPLEAAVGDQVTLDGSASFEDYAGDVVVDPSGAVYTVGATFESAGSNLSSGRTDWWLEAEGEGTLLHYRMSLTPDFWVPPLIGPLVSARKRAGSTESV